MKRIFLFSLSFFLLMVLSSCDSHVPEDLAIHSGHILLNDGRIIKDTEYDPSIHTPVAVVFAQATDEHPTLSVLLDEIRYVSFSETLGFEQGTSKSVGEYDGYKNTVSLQNTHLKADSVSYGSPLGDIAFSHHWFSQSDYIPSVMELRLLYASIDKVNAIIKKCGGTPVSSEPHSASCWYWTSTEVEGNSANQAWVFSMANGTIHKAPKTNMYKARLIVEYNPVR